MPNIFEYQLSKIEIHLFKEAWRAGGVPGCRLSSSGSFFSGGSPVGPWSLNSTPHSGSDDAAYQRGMVGLVGGKILVRMMKKGKKGLKQDLQDSFGGAPSRLMGGGFMLISEGQVLSRDQIKAVQSAPGRPSYQLDASRGNIMLANDKSDTAYLIVSVPGAPAPFAQASHLTQFSQLCLFDGGGPFWFRDSQNQCPAQDGRRETPYFALGMDGQLTGKR